MTIVLREYSREDDAAVEQLWVEAWRSAMPEIDFEARRPWLRAQLERLDSAGASIIVACESGVPVGFVSVDGSGYVDQLAVATTHQHRGLGAKLLGAARLRSAGPLNLWVNAANSGALAFYAANGFKETERGVNATSGLPVIRMSEPASGPGG